MLSRHAISSSAAIALMGLACTGRTEAQVQTACMGKPGYQQLVSWQTQAASSNGPSTVEICGRGMGYADGYPVLKMETFGGGKAGTEFHYMVDCANPEATELMDDPAMKSLDQDVRQHLPEAARQAALRYC